jgi:ribose transport system substrate-binding protein
MFSNFHLHGSRQHLSRSLPRANHTRRSIIGAGFILFCVSPMLCTGAEGSTKPSARPRIALLMKTLTSPFFVQMEKGARRAEAELNIELLIKTSTQETSIEQQIAIIDQLTRARVDAIVVAPADSYRLIPALKIAQDKGIIIVNLDNRLDPATQRKAGMEIVPFISVDNKTATYKVVKYLVDGVRAPTEAAIIEGFRGAANAEERRRGAMQAFAENSNVSVVASEAANWKIDEAYEVTRKLFAAHPRIGLLYCANDMMALGAIRYLQDAHIGQVKIAGYDALDEARHAIRRGEMVASADQQSGQQGFMGVLYAVRMLRGETVPKETMLNTTIVTAASSDKRSR